MILTLRNLNGRALRACDLASLIQYALLGSCSYRPNWIKFKDLNGGLLQVVLLRVNCLDEHLVTFVLILSLR